MKKYIITIAVAGIIIAGGLYGAKHYTPFHTAPVSPSPTAAVKPAVTVVLNTGEEISTVSGIPAENAYTALTVMAKQQNLDVKTKQYSFGVFVEQVGALANSKDNAWIYFVNGKTGIVAADKQSVVSGDMVEWKYIKPSME
jgi:hypothetical protein